MNMYLTWLKKWFSQKGELPNDCEDRNYFELGLIDSFGVFELIEAVETEFNVRFTQEHFQQRRFATLSGLSEIIEELSR